MKKKFDFDLIVIGGGNAGCEAALIAAEHKLKVAIIEANKWGGSNLNYSNIPLGALFEATQLLKIAVDGSRFGLSSSSLRYNFPTLRSWKNLAMERAGADDKTKLEEAGIVCIEGRGHLISAHEVSDGENIYRTKKILLATGAGMLDTGINIPEGVKYLLPSDVPDLMRPPKTVFIVGAGATGCELAQYLRTLGSEVVLADYAARLLPRKDEEVGQVLDDLFAESGIKVLTQSRVTSVVNDNGMRKVIFLRGGLEKSVRVDEVILCTGSAPNTDIGLENAGVEYNAHGVIVDNEMRSSVKHIYACGDICGGESSLERSSLQAKIAARMIINKGKVQNNEVGMIRITKIYPEIAEIGLTEDDCIRQDRRFKKAVLPLGEVAKSNIADFSDGFIKVLADKKGKIIGATIMAPNAGILMQELAFAMRHDMTLADVAETPHLTNDWSELVRQACAQLV